MNILDENELLNYIKDKTLFFSVDRFEEEFAICENRENLEIVNISKKLIPINTKPGDILKYVNYKLVIDSKKTSSEQKEIKNLVNNLFKRKK